MDLVACVTSGNIDAVRLKLAAGEDVNARDATGATLLMLAAFSGDLPMVKLLMACGAAVNAKDEQGWTPLTRAVHNAELNRGFADVVQALIDDGADIEAAIGFGVRPLMLAAGYGETAVVEVLLAAGADVLARNEGGFTALMMVRQKHYVDVINLLHEAEREAGAGEGTCSTKPAPVAQIINFVKPSGRS
jgi:ankyrin repeat protein